MSDCIEIEQWRDIAGYEGLYQVSNLGNVKSLKKAISRGFCSFVQPDKIMKPSVMKIGYFRVTLTKDGKQEQFYIHRLVAEAFLPNPDNLPEVDHIDANRKNNSVENLRWVTHLTNMRHSAELGRNYDGRHNLIHGVNKRSVIRNDGKVYESVISAAKDIGYKSQNMVTLVLTGKRPECRGFSFKYADDKA